MNDTICRDCGWTTGYYVEYEPCAANEDTRHNYVLLAAGNVRTLGDYRMDVMFVEPHGTATWPPHYRWRVWNVVVPGIEIRSGFKATEEEAWADAMATMPSIKREYLREYAPTRFERRGEAQARLM